MVANPTGADLVLFVDDEAGILNSLKRELHGWARERSLHLLTAASAVEALRLLEDKGHQVALICSDLKMPEMLGSDFLLQVKEAYPDIITLLLTGFSETAEVMKAVRAGIFSYILKPWEPDYLQAELSKAYEVFCMKAQRRLYQRTLEEELRWAGEMQKALLKPSVVSSEGIEFRTSYHPVPGLHVGGDFYDVIDLGRRRYLLLLGEVAIRGIRAAFVTGILKAVIYPEYVRSMQGRHFSPAAFLSWLNERMNFELRRTANLMIGFFAGVVDLEERSLTYANAGQCRPSLVRGGAARELEGEGSRLGFAGSSTYTEGQEGLERGDTIVLHSDGLLWPRTGAKLDLGPVLASLEYGPEYHRRLLDMVLAQAGTADFEDDVTLVTGRIL